MAETTLFTEKVRNPKYVSGNDSTGPEWIVVKDVIQILEDGETTPETHIRYYDGQNNTPIDLFSLGSPVAVDNNRDIFKLVVK